jgi:hypothetical protein
MASSRGMKPRQTIERSGESTQGTPSVAQRGMLQLDLTGREGFGVLASEFSAKLICPISMCGAWGTYRAVRKLGKVRARPFVESWSGDTSGDQTL